MLVWWVICPSNSTNQRIILKIVRFLIIILHDFRYNPRFVCFKPTFWMSIFNSFFFKKVLPLCMINIQMKMFLRPIRIAVKKFIPPKHKKKLSQKLLIIPLDQQFSVQPVFALCNRDSFVVCNFLIFEVVKLCRMRIESKDST